MEAKVRVIQFYWTDPLKDGIISGLENRDERPGLSGIKLYQGVHPFKILTEEFRQVAMFAVSHSMPVRTEFSLRARHT